MSGFSDFIDDIGDAASSISGLSDQRFKRQFEDDGFIVSESSSADGTGLPSQKTQSNIRGAKQKRQLMHWFLPEFGVVKMYVNPQSVQYSESKLIHEQLTKGGYVIQYWGEALMQMTISGTTGSSGVEGINVLREVYRSEQLAFDALGLSLAANNQVSGLSDLLDSVATSIAGIGDAGDLLGGALGTLVGAASPTANMLPTNIVSLGSMALGVELYHDGWVFRGFFKTFSFNETVNNIGSFDYNMVFMVTQRRGTRTNFMPWHRSAINGPSNNSINGGIPLTFRRGEVQKLQHKNVTLAKPAVVRSPTQSISRR